MELIDNYLIIVIYGKVVLIKMVFGKDMVFDTYLEKLLKLVICKTIFSLESIFDINFNLMMKNGQLKK